MNTYWLVRPVSDSPTVFSLARRQISLAFLAEREKRVTCSIPRSVQPLPPPPKKEARMHTTPPKFGIVYRTYILLNFVAHAKST